MAGLIWGKLHSKGEWECAQALDAFKFLSHLSIETQRTIQAMPSSAC